MAFASMKLGCLAIAGHIKRWTSISQETSARDVAWPAMRRLCVSVIRPRSLPQSLRDLYAARCREISILYELPDDNIGMAIHTNRTRAIGWRTAGMVLSALLLALSIVELMLRPGDDAALWRGLALSSLYLLICLSQRRLFAPARRRHNQRLR